jgi:hypothetical protein
MTYHAILYQPVSWVGEIIRNFNHLVPGQILPVLQVDSTEGAKAGADWGPPISVHEWEEALRLALAWSGKKGLIAFTGIALLRDKLRLQTMSDILSST